MPLFYNERVFDNATKHYNESFTSSITSVSSTRPVRVQYSQEALEYAHQNIGTMP